MKKYGLLFIFLTVYSNISTADTTSVAIINMDFGGDTLVDVTYGNGDQADIDAGRGVTFGGGINWTLSQSTTLQATGAWKFTTIPQATNGDLTWTRLPLELIAYYNSSKHKVGAGISYHISNKLDGSGVASSLTQDFDNELGYVVSYEYLMSSKMSFVARYTMIEYTPTGGGISANGNSVGLGISMYFGK